ncbi:uncharacterized protein [Acropora muricata]|uniref:uncharacterized protein isoform X2 n=1 Tax=Acropora muricata TaxID=159855 RepID=UPI0034E4E4F9
MAKKQDSPCKNENSSGAAKFGNTLSFLSVLICSAVLVRVEIVNQRVDTVENSLVEIRLQNPDTNFHGFGESFRQEKRERYISRLNLNDQEVRDLEPDKNVRLRTRRFSGSTPDNQDLIVEAVRKEINKTISSLKPEAFCSSKEQICVQGPPGIPGSKGSRGKRGPRGNTGRKGSRGLTGDPGPHGKQGIQGPPGQKGAQGEKGVPGPRGYPGTKGDAGESISAPTVVISPMIQTLRDNQSAIFRCSATGNPKPSVMWVRSDRNWTGHFQYESDGRLEVRGVSLTEAGVYTCVAKNVLGAMNKSAILTVEVPPRVQLAPGPTHVKIGKRVTLPRCKVTGYPIPVVTWRKLGGVLATERALYGEGSLTVVGAIKADTGPYQCRAKNNLGESSAVTTLVVWTEPKFILRPPSRAHKRSGQNLLLSCKASAQALILWRRVGGDWIEDRMKVKNGTLEISSLRKSDSGSYICEAKLLFYTITATTTLRVDFPPILNLTTNGRKGRFGVIQNFTVPTTGRYKIKAWGARGGTHSYNYGYKPGSYYGGKGALTEGIFTLTKGTVLNIVVGHRGGNSVQVEGGPRTSKSAAELGLSVEDNAGTGGGGGRCAKTTPTTERTLLPSHLACKMCNYPGIKVA